MRSVITTAARASSWPARAQGFQLAGADVADFGNAGEELGVAIGTGVARVPQQGFLPFEVRFGLGGKLGDQRPAQPVVAIGKGILDRRERLQQRLVIVVDLGDADLVACQPFDVEHGPSRDLNVFV